MSCHAKQEHADPDHSGAVYATLTRDGTPNPGLMAEALHRAIHGLRNADPTDPLLWAPYIHFGP